MRNRKNRTPIILLSILITLFVLYFIQYQFAIIKLEPLNGYYVAAEEKNFSWNEWFSDNYQKAEDQYLNDFFGFRSFFVRLNHQLSFSLFGKVKTQSVIVGKENYLYELNYIKAWYGDDFIGRDSIEQRMLKLRQVQDTLSQLGKSVMWVFAPGKGAFYPEYIPDVYHKEQGVTNTEVYLQYAEKFNINHIDFYHYFLDNKVKSPYPLYPQYGIHWSFYGTCLVIDSIIHSIEKMRQISMPHTYWDEIKISQPNKEDRDISASMNLLFSPRSFDMAYPQLKYESDSGKTKPSLMVVSDSFFWIIFNLNLEGNGIFSDVSFWYYNKEIYPDAYDSSTKPSERDLYDEISKFDVIIILSTDATLPHLGWDFIEQAHSLFYQ
jgi:hypothetical protein